MINHMNQPRTGSFTTQNNSFIAYVNNKDEATMMPVTKGYTGYIFENAKPIFYVKSCDPVTGQVSFSEYQYEEIVPQPAPDPANFVTKNDMEQFKNEIMVSIAGLIKKEGEVCG